MTTNTKAMDLLPIHRLLAVGEPGAGKTAQIATLPGRKYVMAFDPGTVPFLITRKVDADVDEFLPDVGSMDFTLKGFNKGSRDDKPRKILEPTTYTTWEAHFNKLYDSGSFDAYDWVIGDSLTLLVRAMMNRVLYLNNRYGGIEELSDYRVVGNKLAQIFTAITSMKSNIYWTGHIQTFQDETTKRITTQLGIPGSARDMLPKLFSNIWLLQPSTKEKGNYTLLTRPDTRGFQAIRTVIPNLPAEIDVTIPEKEWHRAEEYGIGAILKGKKSIGIAPTRPIVPTANAKSTNGLPKPDPAPQGAAASDPQPTSA